MQTLLERLEREFGITAVVHPKPDLTLIEVDRHAAETLIRELRDREGYTHLSFMTAIDRIEDGVFTLTYMLHNYERNGSIGVHVDIARDAPEMTSIHELWAQAGTYQRELREMFGIRFPGSPRLDEDFCLEGWAEIPPMRREFDTVAFAEATFTSRDGRATEAPREHMQQIMFPTRGGDK